MDALVEAALRKWPNVPHCYGWLALDARGDWYMRDDRVQAAGPFPRLKGSRILHDKLLGFIARNYAGDERGDWFFQNGPQRVYITLEATPWVWRLEDAGVGRPPALRTHTGVPGGAVREALVDEEGRLYLAADAGIGIVHSLDMHLAAAAVEAGWWQPADVRADDLPARHGFRRVPQPAPRAAPT